MVRSSIIGRAFWIKNFEKKIAGLIANHYTEHKLEASSAGESFGFGDGSARAGIHADLAPGNR